MCERNFSSILFLIRKKNKTKKSIKRETWNKLEKYVFQKKELELSHTHQIIKKIKLDYLEDEN